MPSIETAIWLALRGRVESLVLSPALPVAWPNEAFTKPTGGYLRVAHIPNINRRLFLNGADPHQRLGLLQVAVFGKKNQNAAVVVEIAGLVAAHFPADLAIAAYGVTARVTKAPDVAQPIDDDTHVMVPVTIAYEVFA